MGAYKILDEFGNELEAVLKQQGPQPGDQLALDKYEAFVQKFDVKKTTDDCYTPEPVYMAVLQYVRENCGLSGMRVVRPFFPGGDYKAIEYPEDCVVVDNPPFSILTEIARYYQSMGVRFFLFAPTLTLFSIAREAGLTYIVADSSIVYENGAVVNTSFVSNMFGDVAVMADPVLAKMVVDANKQNKPTAKLPKYSYPENVLTVSKLIKIITAGMSFKVERAEAEIVTKLDSQKQHGKALFGAGFLISDHLAKELTIAEEKARAIAEEKARADFEWSISQRERAIIEKLNRNRKQ